MLILAAVLSIFVYGMIAAMLGTILPDLSQRFKLTPAQNGRIAMAQAIGLMIGSFAAGPLMDIYGKKLGVVGGLLLIAVALVGLRTAAGYGAILLLIFLLGTGGGALVNGGNALPPDIHVESITTAGMYNLLNLFFGLGGLVTPLVAARLFQNNSSRLLIFAATGATVAMLIAVMAQMAPPVGQVAFQASAVTQVLTSPALLLLSATLFLYVSAECGVWNWLARHLIAQGVPESKALTILSLGFALGLLLGRVAVSPVLSSIAPSHVLLGSAALMAITTFLMLQSSSPTAAWFLVFLAGIAMAPVFPTTLAIVNATFSGALVATATGVALTAGWLGLVVSSPIIGSVAGDDPRRLKKALLLLPAFSVLMVIVTLALGNAGAK
ncbi:MAG: MFS transporter [Bryobacterales bacterium]|nr:MFS transporter [Bryobacterales bacterium]